MSRNGDMNFTCRQCGGTFVFTRSEQDFYELKGFGPPAVAVSAAQRRRIVPPTSPALSVG